MASNTIKLIDTAAATVVGGAVNDGLNAVTYQATGATTNGVGSAVVAIEVSNDNSAWITAGTITLTLGTSATTDGFAVNAAWVYTRAKVTTLTGTGAWVTVSMGT